MVDASINDRITSATVTVSYNGCTETVSKIFACAIPNSDANGDLFPECRRRGGGTGFGRLSNDVKISPNPVLKNGDIQIQGLEKFNIESVEIVDMFGNIKSSQKTGFNNLRLGNLNTGIYFVKISTKQGVIQKKIIVN